MDNDNNKNEMQDINDASNFLVEPEEAIIKVIGVGGGGGNAVNYMFNQNIPGINFVICNTDKQHLQLSPIPNRVLLGEEITKGLGAGNVPEVGRKCAEASAEDIRALFNDKTEMVFITAGMGGGTGTGAAPVVANIAKSAGMLTIGIVTIPFMFEGPKKILKALEGAEEMKKHVDALLVINNENLIDLYPDYDFFNAFGKADDTLANAARSISEIISEPCYVNVDFQDVKTILKDSGTAIISTGYGEGEDRISKAIYDALHSPLLKTHDINTSKRLLIKFMCNRHGDHPIKASEISAITEFTSKLPRTIDVKWGVGDNPALGDKVKITVLASGFDVTLQEEAESKDVIIMSSDPAPKKDEQKSQKEMDEAIATFYGHDRVKDHGRDLFRRKYAVLKPSQLDDQEIISLLEKNVAYNREPRFNENLKAISEKSKTAAAAPKQQPVTGYQNILFDTNDFG